MWIRPLDAMNLLVCAVNIALGVFIVVAPHRAAEIWAAERLERLAPTSRLSFLRWYRVFGAILCLAAALFMLDTLVFR